ncbi:MAG: primosomal protein N' [Bacilli bacterium]|nr:primosomal protein N' [Bacilli bacterium]
MKIIDVLTEYGTRSLDRTFSYVYFGQKRIEPRFRVKISFNTQLLMGFVLSVRETQRSVKELEEEYGYSFKEIKEEDIIDEEPLVDDNMMELAKEVADYYFAPFIGVMQAMLPISLSPKLSSLKGPKIAYEQWVRLKENDEKGLTDKQIEMLRLIAGYGPILKKECGSVSILKKLIEAGRVEVFRKEKARFVIKPEEREEPHEMSEEQQKAYDTILNSEKDVILLEGVTGSGKTEVYLRLSENILSKGKSVLMLVPEINLTPVMVEYFSRRFGQKVAILHSELTPAERYDEYRRIAKGDASIVVGARSAIFAPLKNIGLIILDEEHVESYKQDNSPYYHAREVAIMRGKREGCKVLLGSATPTLESKARADKGVYGYASMPHRVNQKSLPPTSIIDLSDRQNLTKESEKLSLPLITEIRSRLEKKEQVLLLINRRGYWTGIECPKCGHIFTCPSCGGNLTFHQEDRMLKCHHCGFVEQYPNSCPDCGNHQLRRIGYGTERVVKEIEDLFPEARVARMDSDIGKVSKNVEKILREFHDGKYDVLVGTQMIAKGHDFPDVTLSAVVLADIGLSLPTYRAAERTFQLIAQAVGRSGRSKKDGAAMIQTYNKGHYAIVYGAKQDYKSFYLKEMQQRRMTGYPPYFYLILLEFSSSKEEKAVQASLDFKREIESLDIESFSTLGPITPFFSMNNGKHKRNLLLKFKKREEVEKPLRELIEKFTKLGGIDISVNVDPLDY